MLIDLTEVLSCDGNVREFEPGTELTALETTFGSFPLCEDEPLSLTLTNTGGKKLLIEGCAGITAVIPCDRCLTDVKVPISLSFSFETDMKSDADKRTEELDETDFITGYELDTDRLLQEELILRWPVKTLCRDDCKGICRKCGKNLNEGDCGCDLTEPDPRMAAIADLFKNDI